MEVAIPLSRIDALDAAAVETLALTGAAATVKDGFALKFPVPDNTARSVLAVPAVVAVNVD